MKKIDKQVKKFYQQILDLGVDQVEWCPHTTKQCGHEGYSFIVRINGKRYGATIMVEDGLLCERGMKNYIHNMLLTVYDLKNKR